MPAAIIEVVVDSVESALAAQTGGAARVELCSGLLEGGVTPSAGLIEAVRKAVSIGVQVMIRPRGGDFVYSDVEFAIMRRDIEIAKSLGADGVVFGILTPDGAVDAPRTAELIALARPLNVTFHRAFDMVADASGALETLIALGADRILTSGLEQTTLEGAETIAALVAQAGDRIIVMPGGGVTPRNIGRIAAITHAKEYHLSGRGPVESPMQFRNPHVTLGPTLAAPEYTRQQTHSDRIAVAVRAVGDQTTA